MYTYVLAITEVLTMLIIALSFALHYKKLASARVNMLKDAKHLVGMIKYCNKIDPETFKTFHKVIHADIYAFYKRHHGKVSQEELEFQFQALRMMLKQQENFMEMRTILKK